jgi:hypothetical protein
MPSLQDSAGSPKGSRFLWQVGEFYGILPCASFDRLTVLSEVEGLCPVPFVFITLPIRYFYC